MPEIVAAFSPGEVIFFGEHSVVYGRTALACAVTRGVEIRVAASADGVLEIRSKLGNLVLPARDAARLADAAPPLGPVARFAAAQLERCGIGSGVKLVIESDIPEQSGMASSAAVSSAIVAAAEAMRGARLEPSLAVERVYEGELAIQHRGSILGSACTVNGGFVKVASGRWERVEGPVEEAPVAVIDTLERCETRLTTASVRRHLEADPAATEAIFDQMDRIAARGLDALVSLDWAEAGRWMNENQECLTKLGVSTAKIARLTEVLRPHVHGIKMTGAGGGGCLVCLVRPGQEAALAQAAETLGARVLETRLSRKGVRARTEEVSCRP